MNRDNLPWAPASRAALAWDEGGIPVSTAFDDFYHSTVDGLAESRYLFLDGNDLPKRFRTTAADSSSDNPFCIGETGFGTGLNFLLTWQAWLESPEPRPALHFISAEKFPLDKAQLNRALTLWPELKSLKEALISAYPPAVPGAHRLLFGEGRIRLDLYFGDALSALRNLAQRNEPQQQVDAWYLDGFTPSRNADIWQSEVLQLVGQLSRSDATFSTFTAASQVRRDLQAAGFVINKRNGFGEKRECLHGRRTIISQAAQPKAAQAPADTPWYLTDYHNDKPDSAIVIGAGLAGCFTAAALASRNIAVTVLDAGELAGGASGNEQGVLYTRLSSRHSSLVDFALQSYLHAGARYRQLFAAGDLVAGHDGALCGSFQQMPDRQEWQKLAQVLQGVTDLAEPLDAEAATKRLGTQQSLPGIWFNASGWLHPRAVCKTLIDHPLIQVMENCGPLQLHSGVDGWEASGSEGALARAACAVIASGHSSTIFPQCDWLPLRTIRGQTTQLPSTAPYTELQAALCHTGYIAPAKDGSHCLGATFAVDDTDDTLRVADHAENLATLATALPHWREALEAVDLTSLTGRVGFRAATRDYLPIVGACPDHAAFLDRYASLRRDARALINQRGPYLPGLYLNTGHGSRGLSSTPVAGELLASLICHEALPLEQHLTRALAPGRFIIRDLSRNRV